jgi:nucleoside-diphosphate-sugar epimerase
MKKKKLLFIGGSSFVGSNISEQIKKKRVIYNISRKNKLSSARYNYNYDLSSPKFLKRIEKIKPDEIFFCVSLNHFDCEKFLDKSFSISVEAIKSILQNKKIIKNLKKFSYLSTSQVYENNLINKLETPLAINNSYGMSHIFCEKILEYFNKKIDTKFFIFRLSNCFGVPLEKKNDCWWTVVNDLCKQSVIKQEIILNSDGSPVRDFIDVKDAAKLIRLFLNSNNKFNIFNIGRGKTYSILEIAKKISNVQLQKFKVKTAIKINKNQIIKKNFKVKKNKFKFIPSKIRKFNYIKIEKSIEKIIRYLK